MSERTETPGIDPIGDEDTLADGEAPKSKPKQGGKASDGKPGDSKPTVRGGATLPFGTKLVPRASGTSSGAFAALRPKPAEGPAKGAAEKPSGDEPSVSAAEEPSAAAPEPDAVVTQTVATEAPAKEAAADAPKADAPKAAPSQDPPVETSPSEQEEPTEGGESPAAPAAAPAPGAEIRLRVFGRTDVGQVREHNEDNFLVADMSTANRGLAEGDRVQVVRERGTVLGVCDGMGGAAAGEVASQLAVDIVYQKLLAGEPPASRDELAMRLVNAIESAGQRIFAESKADRTRRGMGTTSTVATLIDDHLFLGQVGDSRGYLLRGDRLVQVTRDQSLVNQLIEAGQLTEEEAETFEHNNIILQALGTAESVQVDLTFVELRAGDVLLLCSDGLSGMVRNDEIREVLLAFPEPLEACRELTDRANQAGGHDNVTVVVARFEGEGLKPPTADEITGLKYRKYELPEQTRGAEREGGAPSARPGRPSGSPAIELAYDDYEAEYGAEGRHPEDPIELPHEGAPSWIVTMMIVSAVTCVVVAGYYLLR